MKHLSRLVLFVLLPIAVISPAAARTSVAFQTDDGITLRGRLWNGGDDAVVLSHMFGTDQSIWFDFARKLSAERFTVLTYDFRGVGQSGGRLVISRVDRDVLAAIRFVKSRGPTTVFLVGASMGGTASLKAAAQSNVDGVVVIASGMSFQGLDVRPHLATLKVPKLFIVGSRDDPFNTSVEAMYARTPPPKELKIIPTDGHGTLMFSTRHRETIEQTILAFLRKHSAK